MNDYVVPKEAISRIRNIAERPLLVYGPTGAKDELWTDAETMTAQAFLEIMGIPFTNNFFTETKEVNND